MAIWNDVPEARVQQWRDVFEQSQEGLNVRGSCPVCGEPALHRWFHLHDRTDRYGEEWAGRGSQWQWCAACRAYEHSSGFVPRWWDSSELLVDPANLMHDPDPI